jgi:hypothetical protein
VKHKKYLLTFVGDPEAVAFLQARVPKQWDRLGEARARGRAAKLLLGVQYKVTPVEKPRVAGRVKSI